jgi:hypothetical protein
MQATYTQGELQAEVKRLMEQYEHPAATNEPILMIDIMQQQQARNMGYPKWMYHETLEPQHVKNRDQERAIAAQGYKTAYIFKHFPTFVFRRNMEKKFEEPNHASGQPGDFIEQRLVQSAEHWEALQKERKPKTVVGDWCRELAELPPVAEGPKEDPAVTIARLQGELSAMKQDEPRRGPGRPPKDAA